MSNPNEEIKAEGTRRFSDPRLLARERSLAEGERSVSRPRPLSARAEEGAERLSARPPEGGLRQPATPLPLPIQSKWIERGTVLPARVDQRRVRMLYDEFVYVVGPAARSLFELALRTLGRRPSNMSERDFDALVEALASRIPLASARARFLSRAADVAAGS